MKLTRPKNLQAAAHLVATATRARVGAAPLPRMAHIYLDLEEHRTQWPPLKLDEWLIVFRRLRRLDIVKLLGRAPFDRPDLPAILRSIRDEIGPAILQLNTSGENTLAICRVIRAVGWPGLHLRIGICDWQEQAPVRETLRELLSLRRRYGFQLGLNVHISSSCRGDVGQIRDWCSKNRVGFFPGIPVQPILFRETPETLRDHPIDHEDIKTVISSSSRCRGSGYGRALQFMMGRANRVLLNQLVESGPCQRFSCQELAGLIYILPNGAVVPCGLRTESVGNLTHQTLDEIWSSPRARTARELIRTCPGCFQASIQIMSMLYGGRWTRILTGPNHA